MEDVSAVMGLAKIEKPNKINLYVSANWKYKLYELLGEKLKETRNPKDIIGAVMQSDLKQHGQAVMKIIPKIIKAGIIPDFSNQKEELKGISEAKEFLNGEFNCDVNVEIEEDSKEAKASQAMPGKPSIIIE